MAVTFLLLFFGLVIVRYVVFIVCWCCNYHFWILPNFFDDQATVLESFMPLYTFEAGTNNDTGSWIVRLSVAVALVSGSYWIYIQPNQVHAEFLEGQRDFVSDLYNGNLLSDASGANSDVDAMPSMDTLTTMTLEELAEMFTAYDLNDDERLAVGELDEAEIKRIQALTDPESEDLELTFDEYKVAFTIEGEEVDDRTDEEKEVDAMLEEILKEEEALYEGTADDGDEETDGGDEGEQNE